MSKAEREKRKEPPGAPSYENVKQVRSSYRRERKTVWDKDHQDHLFSFRTLLEVSSAQIRAHSKAGNGLRRDQKGAWATRSAGSNSGDDGLIDTIPVQAAKRLVLLSPPLGEKKTPPPPHFLLLFFFSGPYHREEKVDRPPLPRQPADSVRSLGRGEQDTANENRPNHHLPWCDDIV